MRTTKSNNVKGEHGGCGCRDVTGEKVAVDLPAQERAAEPSRLGDAGLWVFRVARLWYWVFQASLCFQPFEPVLLCRLVHTTTCVIWPRVIPILSLFAHAT